MPLQRIDPNWYSTQLTFSTTTTDERNVIGLGFPATALRVINSCADDVYVRLGSSGVATSADMRVRACSELGLSGLPPFSFVSLYTTAATGTKAGVTALGG